MAVTPQMVKELRDKTGAAFGDVKKALDEVGGDMEKAVDWLREKGMAKAAKKSGRVASEGIAWAVSGGTRGVVIEINSETDFAAKNEQFSGFVKQVAQLALENGSGDVEAIKALPMDGKTVGEKLTELIATIGENMTLRRAAMLEVGSGTVGAYNHMGGKIAVLAAVQADKDVADVAKQVAMHVAASNPQALDRNSIDQDVLAREKAIYEAQAKESGKPDAVIAKMVEGRVNKFLQESCLVEQPFVMDPDRTVGKVVADAAAGASVAAFVRFGLGEGVEKQESDFAAEVAAAVSAA
ncbi:MAG: elongation factor Ts [Pseudomonadaceae bacterium]|nr:elongation factor Ts [Pseudomonadaceae bacterium]